jgi:hypothetical protein
MKQFITISIFLLFLILGCKISNESILNSKIESDTIYTNINGKGFDLLIDFIPGESHNYPSFVFWIEDISGKYIQTLYTTKSIATGVFGHGADGPGKWKTVEGEAIRPASLPYWLHKRGIFSRDTLLVPTMEFPIPDAYTGATPTSDFVLKTKSDNTLESKFVLLLEINQPWDWNEYWTNSKYPDNADYKTSCQPSIIYSVVIDLNSDVTEYFLNPIGHGHYAGENGRLYTDLTTLTTALDIVKKVKVVINN